MTANDPTRRNRRLFGGAHLARSVAWATVDMMLAWHLHIVVGLSGQEVGALLFASLALGGGSTLAAGWWLSAIGARGPFVVRLQGVGAIASAILLWLQFVAVDAAMVIAAGLGFRVAFGMMDVAQNALASLLPADDADATRYARLRVALSALARLVIIGAHAVMTARDPVASRTGVAAALAATGVLMTVTSWALVRARFPFRSLPDAMPRGATRLPAGMAPLLLAFAVSAATLPTLNRLLVFMPDTQAAGRGAWLLAAFCVGSMAGPAVHRSPRVLPGWAYPVAFVAVTVVSGVMVIVPAPAWCRLAGAALHGGALAMIGVHLWSAASQVAMADARRGRASDGIVFGAVIFTVHVAGGVGMVPVGGLIEGVETGDGGALATALALTVASAFVIALLPLSGRTAAARA